MSGVVLRLPGDSDDADANRTIGLIAQARRSLAEARTLPDIRRVMEMASLSVDAAQRAARLAEARQAAAEVVEAANEAANDAAAVRIEAQATAGELLREMRERGERSGPGGDHSRPTSHAVTKLEDLGVSPMESSRWQKVASVPEDVRHRYVEETKAAGREVSTAGMLRYARDHNDLGPTQRPASAAPTSTDYPAIAAEARRRMRAVYRGLIDLSGYRPEALVAAIDNAERRHLVQALRQLPAWIESVERELAIHRVVTED